MEGKTNLSRYLKKIDQNSQHLAQNRLTATLVRDLLMGITRSFFIQFLCFFLNCLFFRDKSNGLTWAALRTWTQNHLQNFGTCPGLPLQLLAKNRVFQNDRPELLLLLLLILIKF